MTKESEARQLKMTKGKEQRKQNARGTRVTALQAPPPRHQLSGAVRTISGRAGFRPTPRLRKAATLLAPALAYPNSCSRTYDRVASSKQTRWWGCLPVAPSPQPSFALKIWPPFYKYWPASCLLLPPNALPQQTQLQHFPPTNTFKQLNQHA